MESPGGVAGPPGFSSPAQRMQLGHEDLVWTVKTSRFYLPAGRTYNVRHQSWPDIDSIQRWFATSFFWITLYKPSKLMAQ